MAVINIWRFDDWSEPGLQTSNGVCLNPQHGLNSKVTRFMQMTCYVFTQNRAVLWKSFAHLSQKIKKKLKSNKQNLND